MQKRGPSLIFVMGWLIFVSAIWAFTITAGALISPSKADQLIGIGATYWSNSLAATNTTKCVRASSASNAKCALFPVNPAGSNWKFYNVARITADGPVSCCWALDQEGTVYPNKLTMAGSQRGSCLKLAGSSSIFDERPAYVDLLATGGAVTGICSAKVTGADAAATWLHGAAGDADMYPPCDENDDCTSLHSISGATCTSASSLTLTQKENVGAYLLCATSSTSLPGGTTNVFVTKQHILGGGPK